MLPVECQQVYSPGPREIRDTERNIVWTNNRIMTQCHHFFVTQLGCCNGGSTGKRNNSHVKKIALVNHNDLTKTK